MENCSKLTDYPKHWEHRGINVAIYLFIKEYKATFSSPLGLKIASLTAEDFVLQAAILECCYKILCQQTCTNKSLEI